MICKVKQVAAGVGADLAAGNLCQPVRGTHELKGVGEWHLYAPLAGT
jgi:hypothetical protein